MPSGVTIKGVYVYVHWKSVLDDSLRVQLYWSDDSNYTVLSTCAEWTLSTINFTDATAWTPAKVNSGEFVVSLQKYTSGGAEGNEDKVLVDWVGTLVEYADVRVSSCTLYDSYKGNNCSIYTEFRNYGTATAEDLYMRRVG